MAGKLRTRTEKDYLIHLAEKPVTLMINEQEEEVGPPSATHGRPGSIELEELATHHDGGGAASNRMMLPNTQRHSALKDNNYYDGNLALGPYSARAKTSLDSHDLEEFS